MLSKRQSLVLIIHLTLYSSVNASYSFPSHKRLHEQDKLQKKHFNLTSNTKYHNRQEKEKLNFGQKYEKRRRPETEELQNIFSEGSEKWDYKPEEEGMEGQNTDGSNYGDKDYNVKRQEVEDINYNSESVHPIHKNSEEFEYKHEENPNTQEVEDINFGFAPSHPVRHKPENHHESTEKEHWKGQEVEDINFGFAPSHPVGHKPENHHESTENEHWKGQEVEDINFGFAASRPVGHKPENHHEGTEKEHWKGQEVEDINFGFAASPPVGHKPENHHESTEKEHWKGQEVEDINFGFAASPPVGHKPENHHESTEKEHWKGQEVEDINFGFAASPPVGHKPENHHESTEKEHWKGQEVEDINFGFAPSPPVGHKPENHHESTEKEHWKGQEVEDINFGSKVPRPVSKKPENSGKKRHHKGTEMEKINVEPTAKFQNAKGQKEFVPGNVQNTPSEQYWGDIKLGLKPQELKTEKEEGNLFNEREKGQGLEDLNSESLGSSLEFHDFNASQNKVTDEGKSLDFFTPNFEGKGCLEGPEIPAHSILKSKSNKRIEVICMTGYSFPGGINVLELKCSGNKWFPPFEEMPKCSPHCEPPCQNNGVCLVNNQCSCPKNFGGPQCQFRHKPCLSKPPVSANSYVTCNDSVCVIKCFDTYAFPDYTTMVFLVCHQGQWILNRTDWSALPDCKASCDPPCANGGSCLDFNKCQCPRQYVGPQCQYELAFCDAKKLNFNGYYTCKGKQDKISCTLSCPEGYDTDIPLAEEYICHYSNGTFSPQPVPKCLYEKNTEVIQSDNSWLIIYEGSGNSEKNHVQFQPVYSFPGECLSWKKFHYKNFDGKLFSFDGNCSYILAEDRVENTFRIVIESQKCKSCARPLKIFYQDQEYKIQPNDPDQIVMANGEVVPIPSQYPEFSVVKKGSGISLSLLAIDVTLSWNENDYIHLAVNKNMWNKTGGLCGNFNRNPNDDFLTSGSTNAWNLEIFVQSWVDNVFECENQADVKYNYSDDRAVDYCHKIFSNVHFEKCFDADIFNAYKAACIWDVSKCGQESCACETISEFVRNCKNYLVSKDIPDSTSSWREIADCPFSCPPGKVHSLCGPLLQKSCGSFEMDDNLYKYSECVEGCFCPEGLFQFNGTCVHKEYCPCKWRNKYYKGGEKIVKNCNTCVCQNGEWECTDLKCRARCSVTGNSHYLTFDGKRYEFEGQCAYYLLKSHSYTVESENVHCKGNIVNEIFGSYFSQTSICSKVVTIRYKNNEIKLMRNREVLVNRVEASSLPIEVEGVFIRSTFWHVIVNLPDSVEIWWDGNTNVLIDLPGNYSQKMGGLCGTFNNNQKDDFFTPEGDIEQTAAAFAEKWKVDETCTKTLDLHKPHPWYSDIKCKEIAEEHCQPLRGKVFKDCHAFLDVEPYYRNCLYDVCSCRTELKYCFCSVLAEYAMECSRQFHELPWRNEIRECGLHCPQGQIYQACADSCGRSCRDISMLKGNCEKKCAEGCSCPDGLVLNSAEECIPVFNCPCFFQNVEYKANSEIIMESDSDTKFCTCQNASWSCRPATKLEIARHYENNDLKCNKTLHEEYTTCQPAEPKTCKNMHEKPKHSTRICFPGCVCQKGFVWDSIGKLCVNASECPCHHGGKSYSDGEKIQQDCNFCTCRNGMWSCTERECPSICSVWGDSHFKTFDGKMYDFQGSCDFVLASGIISQFETFFISLQIVRCGSSGVSCPKSIILKVGSPQKEEKVVFRNQNQALIPTGLKRILIREVGLFIFAEVFDLGITVQWDKGARVYVQADSRWKNRVKGLCGNFNNNDLDDFKTPSSGEMSEVSPVTFADSWQLQTSCPQSTPIIDTCERWPHRKAWAVQKCSVMNSEIFESCHSEVSPQPFLERCIVDACGCDEGGDCECLCTAIAAYAEECNLKGVPIKWRTQHLCPLQCEDNSKYSPCLSRCPPKSCDNQFQHFALLQTCSEEPCVEGCDPLNCPPGEILVDSSSSRCIPIASCKTLCLKVDNVTYLEGDLMESDECHSCFCSRHVKVCTGEPCIEVTSLLPPSNSSCDDGQVKDDCIVKCDHMCHHLMQFGSELQCSTADDCVSGCRPVNLKCSPDLFLRDKHTCVLKKDCPCLSYAGLLLKPGEVMQESECEKCQCLNNKYECMNVCTESALDVTTPSLYNYTHAKSTNTPGWDFFQEGNLTLKFPVTVPPPISCPSSAYESLIDKFTRFSASSFLADSFSPVFGQLTSTGTWMAGSNNPHEYLQVDLGGVEQIHAVNVSGWAGNYVSRYYLSYSLNGSYFSSVMNESGLKEVFEGPLVENHAVAQQLPNPIEARYIRFNPIQWHGQISMKVDVLGCKEQRTPTTLDPLISLHSVCNKSFGIGKKDMPDLQITVSSSKLNHGPDFIGFNNEKGWRPLTNSKSEFVQLKFDDDVIFTGITTKGVSQSNEITYLLEESWVERYKLEYSNDGFSWNLLFDDLGNEMVFIGNNDSETEKTNFFKIPIEAKSIKILPVKWHNNIALRLDLMGCHHIFQVISASHSTESYINCNVCPGVLINTQYCKCEGLKWWNGESCVDSSECPCFVGMIAYPIGTTFKTEKCEECVCALNGVPYCSPKICEDCPNGLQKVLTPLCGCLCKPCQENTRLCPTSNTCLDESAWCNGIKDCPDDEINCTYTTSITTVLPTPIPCPVFCPPGYEVVYRNKTAGPNEAEGLEHIQKIKTVKSTKSVKTYRKSKKIQKPQIFTECAPYDCVPMKEVTPTECPLPECPLDYLIHQIPSEASRDSCPLYSCEPIFHSANCSVLSKNIKTFDGVEYKYDICDHVLVAHSSGLWNVTMNKNCNFPFSCSTILRINHGNHLIELHSQNRLVKIDSFPYTDDQLEFLNSKISDFLLNPVGKSFIFKSEIYGFEILYNTAGNFEITVPSFVKGHLSGLCGLYNGYPEDDKTKPDGTLSKTTFDFGDSWFNPGGNKCVETTCPIEIQNKSLEICLTLKEKPFNLCFKEVNLELCVESTCDCLISNKPFEECRCQTLSDFAAKCKNSNLVGWRVEHNCPSSCPSDLAYYDCYPYACQPTCGNEKCVEAPAKCYSGCFCPDGLVKKGNQCIKIQDCRDCLCTGMGDSTYLTFDGGLTFNGNCTYVATREKKPSGIPNFEVLISNSLCNGSNYMTCTMKVEIKVIGHSLEIVALPDTEESVMLVVDGMKVSLQPEKLDKIWSKIAFNPESSSVHVELPWENVDVRYFYKRFAFTIGLPSHLYSDRVEGLCGTCSQRIVEPEEIDDPEVWQTEKNKNCIIEPPLSCSPPLLSKNTCLLMNSTQVFGQCLAIVDPTPFIDQCLTLACLNEEICIGLEAYGQACRDAGVCVDWRSDTLCPVSCVSDLEYQACGCPRTCENYDEITSPCGNVLVEGCFCPNEGILINGTCKARKYCEYCDEQGQHFEDEIWQPDKCTYCSCKNHVITCSKTECPPETPITCKEDEIVIKEQTDFACCENSKCVCKNRDQCEKIEIPNNLAPGMEAVLNETGCCPRVELVCRVESCPAPNPCKKYYIQKVINTTECCPKYLCEKLDDVCIYEFGDLLEGEKRVKRGQSLEIEKKIGEQWSDGPCKICVCILKNGIPEVACNVTDCPSLEDYQDHNEYELELVYSPEKCCPNVVRKSCKHNGFIYKVGDTWMPDSNNLCETMKCNDWGDGQIVKETRLEVCDENCEFGWRYKPSENACCGQCVQAGCILGDKIYNEGEISLSEDRCSKTICSKSNGHFLLTTELEKCPSIEHCSEEDIYNDGCCLRCKIRAEDKKLCSPQLLPPESTVKLIRHRKGKHGECYNVHAIKNFTHCVGNCMSYTVFKPETWSHKSVCKCCQPEEYSSLNVKLLCDDGKDLVKIVKIPSKCSCITCGG